MASTEFAPREQLARLKNKLFDGRIARTTFVVRVAVLAGVLWLLSLPLSTFLYLSPKTLWDFYLVVAAVIIALCLVVFVSAYVKRLHDMGLNAVWALVLLIALPIGFVYAASLYESYRASDGEPTGAYEIVGILMLGLPLVVAVLRGSQGENRFGPRPLPVESLGASKLVIAAAVGAVLLVVPTAIYAGLFQSKVWVERGPSAPSMPMIDSGAPGQLLIKCWNLKGVGAGVGNGPMGGVYRDGYADVVFDFLVSPDGQIDIATAGPTLSKSSYRADGFRVLGYGLDQVLAGTVPIGKVDRFAIVAVHESSDPQSVMNFTTFAFANTGEIWPKYQVVMTTGLSAENTILDDAKFPKARGRLMIGDCIAS